DLVLGAPTNATTLAPGQSYTQQVTGIVPFGSLGAYTVFFRLDTGNVILESNESDNLVAVPIQVLFAPPPADLTVDAVTVPATGNTGQPISVSWRVTNNGTATTQVASWSDQVFLSSDAVFGGDVLLGTFTHTGALDAGGSYGQVQNVTLPVNLAAGTYTLFVLTDSSNQLNEPGAENNNVGQSPGTINVSASPVPDLQVTQVIAPASGVIGQPVSVTWTVRNNGDAAANGTWTDRVFLSLDGTLSGATQLGSFDHTGPLNAGTEY